MTSQQNNFTENKSFGDVISQGRIRIPKIQRDYAQGRENDLVKEIRKQFVHNLMLVVNGRRPAAEMDFVYGSQRRDAFEPLDGQQRLTTLFLLHWIYGVNLLDEDGTSSCLTYETRNTSAAFCSELVKHSASQFIEEAKAKKPKTTVSELIRQRDWFQWSWKYDPTISSMLVMIDAIIEEMDEEQPLDLCRDRLKKITFNHLDLGVLGMSDELFIKMNARGKQLSDFDKLKSTLEEELQLQQKETDEAGVLLADSDTEEAWRSHMDGSWIDFFWQRYAGEIMLNSDSTKEEKLKAAKQAESKMKIFLLRMMAMQLFATHPANEEVYKASYQMDSKNVDAFLIQYQDSLVDWRSKDAPQRPADYSTLDFNRLIEDVNNLLIETTPGKYTEITALIPPTSNYNSGEPSKTYLDQFTEDKHPNDLYVIFYGIILFLRQFPYKQDKKAWLENFNEYVKFLRNVFLNDNNNEHLDKIAKEAQAFKSVEDFISDLSKSDPLIYEDPTAFLNYLSGMGEKNTYTGISNPSLREEQEKAKLRLSDSQWTTELQTAETHPYLWGQVRPLIKWADGDIDRFKAYRDQLLKLIDATVPNKWDSIELSYPVLLSFTPGYWAQANRLYRFNKDRDNGMKRYLRDMQGNYGEAILNMLEVWMRESPHMEYMEFCNSTLQKTPRRGWQGCLALTPKIIWWSSLRRVFEDNGHAILAQQKTDFSHCYDFVHIGLRQIFKEKFDIPDSRDWFKGSNGEASFRYFDSKTNPRHQLELRLGNDLAIIKWGEAPGSYVIERGEAKTMYEDVDSVMAAAIAIIDEMKASTLKPQEV